MKPILTKTGTVIRKINGGRSNVFLASNDKINILVDTGPAFMGTRLIKKLRLLSVNSIDILVLTHTHFDHAANADKLKKKFGLKVIVHETEADYLLSGNSPVPAGTNAFTGWMSRTFGKWTEKRVRYSPCTSDITFRQEYELAPAGINARILHTPGHSKGSSCLIVDNEIALVGDTLFGVYHNGCFPPFADNVPLLIQSWEKLLNTDCRLFLPGHGHARSRQIIETALKKKRLFKV